MRILVVEDDTLQAEDIQSAIASAFPKAQLEHLRTESQLRKRVDELAAHPPDIILLDVMLPWMDPSSEMAEPPAEVQRNGGFRAGLRCERLLREKGVDTPIILYTILETMDLQASPGQVGSNVFYFRKEASMAPLTQLIQQLLAKDRRPP
jgi:CheY-like chemotaxis protein